MLIFFHLPFYANGSLACRRLPSLQDITWKSDLVEASLVFELSSVSLFPDDIKMILSFA
jgi:hypothetical protein